MKPFNKTVLLACIICLHFMTNLASARATAEEKAAALLSEQADELENFNTDDNFESDLEAKVSPSLLSLLLLSYYSK